MGQFTRRQILDLDNALAEIERIPGSIRFTLWIARAREHVHARVREMRERGRLPEATARVYAAYESARIACARQHALKDTRKEPVCDADGQFVIADYAAFERAVQEIQASEPFREACTAVDRQRETWTQWMQESIAVDLPALPEAFLPNTLTGAQVRPLLPWIASAVAATPVA